MRRLAWTVLLASSSAAADGFVVRKARQLEEQQQGPLLNIDPNLAPTAEGIDPAKDKATFVIQRGRARLVGQGEWFESTLTPQAFGPEVEDVHRGWRAGYELSYDLGWFRVGGTIAVGHVDNRYQRGTYRFVGVSLFRNFTLSRWMKAWISLGIGKRTWYGAEPPDGESNDTFLGLSLGTTFR